MRSKKSNSNEDGDERAVSPVIGVILMVAITVILAAVIAAFVLDLGDTSAAAQATYDWNQDGDDNEIVVSVTSADRLDGTNFVTIGGCEWEHVPDTEDPRQNISTEMNSAGDSQNISSWDDGSDDWRLDNDECEPDDEIQIIGVYDGEENVIQTIELDDSWS